MLDPAAAADPVGPLVWVAVIVPSIGALAAAIVSVITALKNGRKADALIDKTSKIQASTDGNLSAVKKSLEVADERIRGLETLVRSMAEGTRAADELARNPTPAAAAKKETL